MFNDREGRLYTNIHLAHITSSYQRIGVRERSYYEVTSMMESMLLFVRSIVKVFRYTGRISEVG